MRRAVEGVTFFSKILKFSFASGGHCVGLTSGGHCVGPLFMFMASNSRNSRAGSAL